LSKATLTLNYTGNVGNDLNIDMVSMTDTSLPAGAYVMDRIVLSPASNPYARQTPRHLRLDCNGRT